MSIKGKVKMIQKTENEKKTTIADVCREFGLINYTLQNIWKNRTRIISAKGTAGE